LRISRGMKLGVIAVAGAMVLAACSSSKNNSGGPTSPADTGTGSGTTTAASSSAPVGKDVKVGMAYDVGGRGDKSFNDLAAAGLDKAKSDLGVQVKELAATVGETEAAKESRLKLLADAGYNPIVAVGFAYSTAVGKIVPLYPKVNFAIIDDDVNCGDGGKALPNLECLMFHEEQSSYLVGVAAAQATKTKNVGFIGGVDVPLIQKFQAGFQAGVKSIDSSIKVQVKYLTEPPDFGGFNDPAKGKTAGLGMYAAGADVVYAAAGGSGAGLFDAAKQDNKLAIGVDSDQYQSAPANEKALILTSALKGVDTATFTFISNDVNGKFKAGATRFGLSDDGVGYATSNPAIAPYKAKIEAAKAAIIAGTVVVPTKTK
jgi:basic membrane protein A and related proteins